VTGSSGHRIALALAAWLLTCAVAAAGPWPLSAPAARAAVYGFGAGDESIGEAQGPILPGVGYSGAFAAPAGQQDLDYLYFDVAQPETLRFEVLNTLPSASCTPYAFPGSASEPGFAETEPSCWMWATLLEADGQQLGGAGSAAGTRGIEASSYEELQWTFVAPGRYYIVLESEYYGERPSFRLSYGVVPAGGGGGAGGSGGGEGTGSGERGGTGGAGGAGGAKGSGAIGSTGGGSASGRLVEPFLVSGSRALIRSLTAPARARGSRVVVSVVLAQRLASLDLQLFARTGPRHRLTLVGRRLRRHPLAGAERIAVPVKAGRWLSAKRYTPLVLRVRALALDGASELIRGRLLLRR
jgi:hypothetical protein